MSKYKGSVLSWVSFISAWTKKNHENEVEILINEDGYNEGVLKRLPKSFVDFYFAMNVMKWPDLLRVEADDDESVMRFFDIDDLNVVLSPCVPVEFFDENYRVYDKSQEKISPYLPSEVFSKMLLVAEYEDGVFDGRIFLNPYVTFDDGEWEAVFLEMGAPYEVRFPSFADLVVWFYLKDPISGVFLNNLYGDHLDDSSGLSRILFD